MVHTNVGQRSIEQEFSDLGVQFLLTDLGKTDACLHEDSLRELAALPSNELSPTVRRHLDGCPRCAHLNACFRAAD